MFHLFYFKSQYFFYFTLKIAIITNCNKKNYIFVVICAPTNKFPEMKIGVHNSRIYKTELRVHKYF